MQRIDTDGRFVWQSDMQSPAMKAEPLVVEGDRLRALLAAARCRTGSVLWKGGIPATMVFADGSRLCVDGFSFYGGFLRIHRKQWCDFPDDVWIGIWKAP